MKDHFGWTLIAAILTFLAVVGIMVASIIFAR